MYAYQASFVTQEVRFERGRLGNDSDEKPESNFYFRIVPGTHVPVFWKCNHSRAAELNITLRRSNVVGIIRTCNGEGISLSLS